MYSNRWDSDFDNWREGEYEAKKEDENENDYEDDEEEEEENEDEMDEDVYYPTKKDKWSMYKTQLCYEYLENSICSQGDLCLYAHSKNEIRRRTSPIPIRVKEMLEKQSIFHPKPNQFDKKQKEREDKLNFDLARLKYLHSKRDFENKQSQEEFKKENTKFEDKKLGFNKSLNNSEFNVQKLKNEIDQLNKVNAALVKKNSELTENLNITNQQNKQYKLNNSQMSKDLKEQSKKTEDLIKTNRELNNKIEDLLKANKGLNKKTEGLTKTNQELTTNYHNQKAISDLYLRDCKVLQKEVQLQLEEIKKLKSLLHNYNPSSDKIGNKNIVIGRQNEDILYKDNYFELIFQLKDLFECPLSLDCLKNPIILPSGFTIDESYFDRLINSKDPYNNKFIVKQKIHNRFAIQVKEIVETSEEQTLKQQQSYEEFKAQLDIDRQECSKDTQTDFVSKSEDIIEIINQLRSLLEDYKLDGHRNQQTIEKLEERLAYSEREKARIIELLKAEQIKNEAIHTSEI